MAKGKINLKDTTTAVIPPDTLVSVKSNCYGRLIWKSKDGAKVVWDNYGDTHDIYIRELREMRISSPRFFADNLIIITGFSDGQEAIEGTIADIYKTIGIIRFYNGEVDLDGFDDIHKWSEKEIKSRVKGMTKGAKENLAVAVIEGVASGKLDSFKTVEAFEEALGCKLTQPK
jgi:hypothetical protein